MKPLFGSYRPFLIRPRYQVKIHSLSTKKRAFNAPLTHDTVDTRANDFFKQIREGHDGSDIVAIKIRTMRVGGISGSTVTVQGDARITKLGSLLVQNKKQRITTIF